LTAVIIFVKKQASCSKLLSWLCVLDFFILGGKDSTSWGSTPLKQSAVLEGSYSKPMTLQVKTSVIGLLPFETAISNSQEEHIK
jgi:hypothetical protein